MFTSWNILNYIMISFPFLLYIALLMVMNKVIEKVPILRQPSNKHILSLIKNTMHIFTIILTIIMALSILGIDIHGIITSLGLLTFGVGFALKDVISSIISSYALMLYRPFHIGDDISIKGITGTVTNMDTRYTILVSENETHFIPNSEVMISIITLKKRSPEHYRKPIIA
jgi:small conductance mechanosensitive channel